MCALAAGVAHHHQRGGHCGEPGLGRAPRHTADAIHHHGQLYQLSLGQRRLSVAVLAGTMQQQHLHHQHARGTTIADIHHCCLTQTWYKPLASLKDSMAVLLINNDDKAQDLSVTWKQLGVACADTACTVRDLWAHKDLGSHSGGYTATQLASRDSAFLLVH